MPHDHDNRLVLHPRAIGARAGLPELLTVLRDTGLIDGEFDASALQGIQGHYQAGPRFLEHVSFLGCSPTIRLEPPEPGTEYGTEFCHIEVDCGEQVKFLGSDNVRSPQCPQCKADDEQWQEQLARWRKAPEVFTRQCPNCGATKPLQMLNWKQTAGFAAVSVHIWGVHEGEAVPNDELLQSLEALTRGPWDYFYRVTRST